MKYFLLCLKLACTSFIFSQGWMLEGSAAQALGGAVVAKSNIWSYHHNPAAMASIKKFGMGVSYSNRFLTKEIQSQNICAAIPLGKGVLGFGGSSFGYEFYRLSRLGLSYSMNLTDNFALGVQSNLNALRLAENPKLSFNPTIELGTRIRLNEKVVLGASVFNLSRQKIQGISDRYETTLRFGAEYSISKVLGIYGEIQKQILSPVALRAGIEYKLVQAFYLRVGAGNTPNTFSFGFAYYRKLWSIDFSSIYQDRVGWTPGFALNYNIDGKE